MDLQKEFTLFSSVDEKVPLTFKDDESEKGQRALQVDVQHMLKQTPYQETTKTVTEGIPNGHSLAIDTGKSTSILKTEHVKQFKVYSEAQELARTSELVPPIGKTSPVEDGVKDREEKGNKIVLQEVLIDIGTDGGSDHSSSEKQHIAKEMDEFPIKQKLISLKEKPRTSLDCVDAIAIDIIPIRKPSDEGDVDKKQGNGFLWKMLAFLFLVIGSITVAFVMFGKMSHIDVNKNIPPSPDENKMNMYQLVKVRFSHQIQKRSEPVKILAYKILDQGEDCTDGIKRIQEMCQEGERALCVRNNTWKTLVAVCVENITMDVFCPVFTLTISKGTSFYAVQADWQSVCENCSDYGLWDIGKYPQCLQLEKMDTTTIDSTTTTNSTFVTPTPAGKKEDGEGLSGGYIALIVVPTVVVILVVVLVVLYKLGHLQRLREIPVRQEDI